MWTYNNYIYPDELYHYGVPGQKWGVRRDRVLSGKKVYQGRMTDTERQQYAKKRIKAVGAKNAMNAEKERAQNRVGVNMLSNFGLFGMTVASLATGNGPAAIAAGSAFIANGVRIGSQTALKGNNAAKNSEAIRKEAGMKIKDTKVSQITANRNIINAGAAWLRQTVMDQNMIFNQQNQINNINTGMMF